ncbi:MAG: hypothetical protein EBT15_08215 [Betaproteobacteria bacterium]|nr:hypothetical protein [Betaproteobacteria bacterium]
MTVKAVKAEPVKVVKPAPVPKPKKQAPVSAVKKAAAARRKLEERRDRLFANDWDDVIDDYEDVKKWL